MKREREKDSNEDEEKQMGKELEKETERREAGEDSSMNDFFFAQHVSCSILFSLFSAK